MHDLKLRFFKQIFRENRALGVTKGRRFFILMMNFIDF